MTANQEPVIANKVRCICCGQEVASYLGRHHFNQLACRNGTFVDGGAEYGRMGGRDLSLIETWNNNLQKWNESDNQVAKDLFRNGLYDFPAYDTVPFMEYLEKKEAAEKALKEALFAAHGLTGGFAQGDYTNKPDRLWYAVWNMPFRDTRDPDPRDVYFHFLHFVDLVKK